MKFKNILKVINLVLILFFIPIQILFSQENWEIAREPDWNCDFADVFFLPDGLNGWAVGLYGTVIHTTDGGVTWNTQTSNTGVKLNSVYFLDENNGWAVGYSGVTIRTTDGGNNWTVNKAPTISTFYSVFFIDLKHGWAAGETYATYYYTTDGGDTWIECIHEFIWDIYSIFFIDHSKGWMTSYFGKVYCTADSGKTWNHQNTYIYGDLYSICFIDENRGWVVGESGSIAHTDDGGNHWIKQESHITNDLQDVHFIDEDHGWAIGSEGSIICTEDGGANWNSQASGTMIDLYGVRFTDANHGWAVGSYGLLMFTMDGGQNWNYKTNATKHDLKNIFFINDTTSWIVGEYGLILHNTENDNIWDHQVSGTMNDFESVWFSDMNKGWAVGESGTILSTNNGGIDWNTQDSGVDDWLRDVCFINSEVGWAVGGNTTSAIILHTSDGGDHWIPQVNEATDQLKGVYFTDADTGWAVGGEYNLSLILHTTDGGNNWFSQTVSSKKRLYNVYFIDNKTGWAVGTSGTIVHTKDGGLTWFSQNSGTSKYLYGVYFADAYLGWAVGADGTILHTINGGSTWSTESSDVEDGLNAVFFTQNNTCWAIGDNGIVLKQIKNIYNTQKIALSKNSVDFGEVIVGEFKNSYFYIRNLGKLDLIISNIEPTNGQNEFLVKNADYPMTVPPYDSVRINLEFSPESEGDRSCIMNIYSNDPTSESTAINLSGYGMVIREPEISVSEEPIDFDVVFLETIQEREYMVENTGNDTLTISEINKREGSDEFSLISHQSFPVIIPPFSSIDLTFSFEPTIKDEQYSIFTIHSNDPTQPSVEVTLIGNKNRSLTRLYLTPAGLTEINPIGTQQSAMLLIPMVFYGWSNYTLQSDIKGSLYGIHLSLAVDIPFLEFPRDQGISVILKIGSKSISKGIRFSSESYSYYPSPYVFETYIPIEGKAGDEVQLLIMASPSNTFNVSILIGGGSGSYVEIPGLPDEIAPSAISDLSVDHTSTESFQLKWTAPGDDGLDGKAYVYDIRIQTDPPNGDMIAWWKEAIQIQDEPVPSVAGIQDSMTVIGLSENLTYYFAMKTGDDGANWSGLSNLVSYSTEISGIQTTQELPKVFILAQNHPNPFNPSTTISFAIPDQESSVQVKIIIFDLMGKLVRILVDEQKVPGYYSVQWDGTNQIGNKVTSGLYVCRMEAGSYRSTRKMVMWK